MVVNGALEEVRLETGFGRLTALVRPRSPALDASVPVLALHGWLDNAASFVPLAGHWPSGDFVALDMPGHGRSAHLPFAADYSVVALARAAFAAGDALGWERFAVLGHSLGAAVACAMAAACPDRIERLALVEALGPLAEDETRTAQRLREAFAAQAALARKSLRVFPDLVTGVRIRMMAGELPEPFARLLTERGIVPVEGGFVWSSDPRLTLPTAVRMTEGQVGAMLAGIRCPVSLVYATPDFEFMPERLRVARLARLPQARTACLPGGHHLHMESPEAVARALRLP